VKNGVSMFFLIINKFITYMLRTIIRELTAITFLMASAILATLPPLVYGYQFAKIII